VDYGERLELDGCHLTFYPAGHVLGSAQTLVETPFGRDLTSARALNDDLRRWFDTAQTGSYQFPKVRPLIFGINPSWAAWQASPQYTDGAMMANIKAAIKHIKTSEQRRQRNVASFKPADRVDARRRTDLARDLVALPGEAGDAVAHR